MNENGSRILIKLCFYNWKLLKGKIKSVTVKRAPAVLVGLFLQMDLSLKCLLQRTMTLKISRPVN